jgi:NitT/TauT family transport system permease protein
MCTLRGTAQIRFRRRAFTRRALSPGPTVQSGWEKVSPCLVQSRSQVPCLRQVKAPETNVSGLFLVLIGGLMSEPDRQQIARPMAPCDGNVLRGGASLTPTLARFVHRRGAYLFPPLALALFLATWQLVVWLGGYPPFILPSPGRVYAKLRIVLGNGMLWWHTRSTLEEILGGLALGLSTAVVLGYVMAKSRSLERLISPYIVASQSVPIVALAPLLVIWFGSGRLSKVLVCALTIFFPMLVNTMVGVRSVDRDLVALMRSLRATRWQMFTLLEVPASLPVLLGGLKVSVTLSVIGAVVGEFVAADRGLGFLINVARGNFDTPLMFVALFALIAIALAFYLLVVTVETVSLYHRRAHLPPAGSAIAATGERQHPATTVSPNAGPVGSHVLERGDKG